nr:N-acetyl-gamma-glutamyl-phosphate reductase [Legionellales bacterium]
MTQPNLLVAICGAHGYSGQALISLVLQHPHLQLAGVFSRHDPTETHQRLPLLARHQILIWPMTQFNEQITNVDIVLLATPPATSMELVRACAQHSVKVIDLSGAFRLPVDQFEHWYQMPHTATDSFPQTVYGLQPWHQTLLQHQSPSLIANPGCYATGALMALLPLIEHSILQSDSIIIDAKS